ncbi:aldehyde dehydrogenase family protein, partial [Escherichia coli]|nr:aldehyde dehydrogenase family protein [Escherichia coli]
MQSRDNLIHDYGTFIGGQWTPSESGRTFDSYDPFTAKVWAKIPHCDAVDVDRAVTAARAALETGPWGTMHPTQRGQLLRRLADLIARDADRLALAEVRDNGKLWAEMRGQCGYIPQWFHYFAGLADKIEGAVLPIDKP